MKYIILAIALFTSCHVLGQDRSVLQISYPQQFHYDDLIVLDSAGTKIAENSNGIDGDKIVSLYTLKKKPHEGVIFHLCFENRDTGTWDTLTLIGKGADIKIEVQDSFKMESNYNIKLYNAYSSEELFSRYFLARNSVIGEDALENAIGPNLSPFEYYQEFSFNFIKKNLENVYTPDLFSLLLTNPVNFPSPLRTDSFYNHVLRDVIVDSQLKNYIEDQITQLTAVDSGSTAPAFSVYSMDGILLDNNTLRGKNILISFWATWCVPCKAEFPYLREIYSQYKNENLKMISVSVDDLADSLKVREMVENENLGWLQVLSNSERTDMRRAFKVNPIPALFLINEKGVIEYNSIKQGGSVKLGKLKEILAQKYGRTYIDAIE